MSTDGNVQQQYNSAGVDQKSSLVVATGSCRKFVLIRLSFMYIYRTYRASTHVCGLI